MTPQTWQERFALKEKWFYNPYTNDCDFNTMEECRTFIAQEIADAKEQGRNEVIAELREDSRTAPNRSYKVLVNGIANLLEVKGLNDNQATSYSEIPKDSSFTNGGGADDLTMEGFPKD